jgi:hypothetical protein
VVFVESYPARAGGIATFSGDFRAAHDVTVGVPSRAIAIDEPGGFVAVTDLHQGEGATCGHADG